MYNSLPYIPVNTAELLVLEKSVGILRNEEGALLSLKGNRKVYDEIIAGTFFIVGINKEGNITSLSEENLKKYQRLFWQIEDYSDDEVSKSYWDKFERTIAEME